MVLLIIIPTKNGYFIGGIHHFQTYPCWIVLDLDETCRSLMDSFSEAELIENILDMSNWRNGLSRNSVTSWVNKQLFGSSILIPRTMISNILGG